MQLFVETANTFKAVRISKPLLLTVEGSLRFIDTLAALDNGSALVLPDQGTGVKRAALFSAGDLVRVNGKCAAPIVILERGDAIQVGRNRTMFFTDEDPLEILAFDPATAGGVKAECSRCHGPVNPGDPVVLCPICGLPYMAQGDKDPNCWTFGPCLGCGRDPHVPYVWHPGDELENVPWFERAGRDGSRELVTSRDVDTALVEAQV